MKSHKPPQTVASNAKKGLELRKLFKRGGTMVGVARARDLMHQKEIPIRTIKRMYSYFKRHTIDKQAKNFGDDKNPSPGYVAWLLWGGDAGYAWVKGIMKTHSEKKN